MIHYVSEPISGVLLQPNMQRTTIGLLFVASLLMPGCATTPPSDPDAAKWAMAHAAIAIQKNEMEQAMAHLDQAVRLNPRFADAYLRRGMLHGLSGNRSAAISDLDRVLKLSPELAVAYHYRALALEESGKVRQAIRDLDTAIAIEPQSGDYLNHRGYLHGWIGEYERSLRDLDRAVEYKPHSATAHYNRAFARFCVGDLTGTLSDIDRALELRPSLQRAHFLRALSRELTGDLAGAEKDLKTAQEREPDSDSVRLSRTMLVRQMRPEMPEEHLLILSGDSSGTWQASAAAYLAGELASREFVAAARHATGNRDTNLCWAYYVIGRTYELNQDGRSAISAYKKCLNTRRYAEIGHAAARIRLKRLIEFADRAAGNAAG